MAEPFATVTDLATLWRPLSAPEQSRAEGLLEVASAMVRQECPGIDTKLAADPPLMDPSIPRWVVCQAVKRVMQSSVDMPSVTQQQQTVGPVSLGFTLSNPSGDMYVTRSELTMLGQSEQVAVSIPMRQGDVG
ncbi:MAG: phage Gp19/Gp15/Gp42 family protein [Propionibacteriaceae bacterium]|nr:phage Gp19/Gp15/Gp42 family protein [Propionibacteriaceae bacterium]